jgi:hypothetical protein
MVIKDLVTRLLPQADELVRSLFTRRLDLAEAIAVVEGIAVPANVAVPWYRALATAAGTRNPELENWALRKALDAGAREADLLSALQRNWQDQGNLAEADALDAELARALCASGRAVEALPSLRRLCEALRPGSAAPLDAAAAGAILAAARDPGAAADRAAIRAALRAWLPGFDASGKAYNLVALDLDGPGEVVPARRLEAFYALLSDPKPALREPFAATRDLRFLIRAAGALHLIEAGRSRRVQPDGELFAWAALAAQFLHAPFAGPPPAEESVPVPGPFSRRELAAREADAIANMHAMVPLLADVLGAQGFAHPEVRNSIDAIRAGADRFFATGVNSEPGYGKLVSLYCATNGLATDFLSFLLRLYNPPYRLGAVEGILGRFTEGQVDDIAAALRRDGLYRFPRPIPQDLLEDLIRVGKTMPCFPHREHGMEKDTVIYPDGAPKEMKYDFIERDLVPLLPVQRIMGDPGLLAISQAYFGAKPVLDAVAMWWSTHLTGQASSEAAQLYHFDMERIKWLKWFIYLTDVTTDTGPHCFVRGSHRTGAKPPELLQRGYQRISDSDMAAHYPAADLLELNGPKGSIFVEDTSGFHKGKPPRTGPRLVIELEFTNSLYGAPFTRETVIGRGAHPALLETAAKYPQVLCQYAVRS